MSIAERHYVPRRTLQLVRDAAEEVAVQAVPVVDDFITSHHVTRAEVHDVADRLRLVATLLEHSPAVEQPIRTRLQELQRRRRPPQLSQPNVAPRIR